MRNPSSPNEPPPLLGRMGMGPPRMPGKVEKARDARGAVARLWGYLRRQRVALLITAALVIVSTAINVALPHLLGHAIDAYVVSGDLPGLAHISLLMLGLYVLSASLTWLQSYIMAGASQRAVRDIRNDLFCRLQALPLRFFDQRPHGDLMSRLTNDVESVNQALSDGVVQIVSGALGMLGVAAIMLWINPVLAIVSIAAIGGMSLALNRWLAPRLRTGFRQQQTSLGALNALIEETITGQRVVKAYGREPAVIAQFDAANAALRQAATRAQIFAGFLGPTMNCVNNLGLAVVASVGGVLAVQGLATVGMIASFITYARQFGRPLNELATLYAALQSAVAGAERVFAVMDETPEIEGERRADAPKPAAPIRGEVVFEEVSFGYTPDVPVLKRVSLHARSGQMVALVGPTGAGKTTIINLLTRFYDVDSGRIMIDGRDIREFDREALRRQLGIVLQDTFLFTGTVLENIRYGRLDASDADVIAAAKLANADAFIQRLPHGYDTLLSERASNLSQGQRQLLAIARAILADPRILILDEATSSVDTRTEQHIQEAMRRLMAGRTSFVIAHRLSTIRDADQILVISGGEVVERGTHAQLLAANGLYARLYAGQFGQDGRYAEPATKLQTVAEAMLIA
ncbi:MAG: ABC transporter ATP-binding protein [Anaerolineae bacterium]|nr:ABC transporter ATP-binding protein/permease [Candidatus Roseilinea sp.]MDW8451167.1 ABC transporter ATP-binding protein [Anaerolineae bacterium]